MHEELGSWEDVGGDPDSLMRTRQVWGGGMDGLDLDEWNVAAYADGKPVLAFHKVEHTITFDPEFISAEEVQDLVSGALLEMQIEKTKKKHGKAFWQL